MPQSNQQVSNSAEQAAQAIVELINSRVRSPTKAELAGTFSSCRKVYEAALVAKKTALSIGL